MSTRTALEFSPGAAGPLFSPDEDLSWQDLALCAEVDPELWFPEKGGGTRKPKRICRMCEVRTECLEYALETGQRFGIWGGLSPQERLPFLRSRNRAQEAA